MSTMHRRKPWLEGVEHHPPLEILAELQAVEQEILQGTVELEGMLQ